MTWFTIYAKRVHELDFSRVMLEFTRWQKRLEQPTCPAQSSIPCGILPRLAVKPEGPAHMVRPKNSLLKGAQTLEAKLLPNGFQFRFRGERIGSGGKFAWGEFVCGDRRLEIHFRRSLGLVRYHVGNQSASHEYYMRELEVLDQCLYPGFSDDPMKAFDELAHDLSLAADFLAGSATILLKAAAREKADAASRNVGQMAGYVGDSRKLDQLRRQFRERQYAEVIKLAGELKYPNRMTLSERRMVEIASQRTRRIDNRS